jgi:hypothetical protein
MRHLAKNLRRRAAILIAVAYAFCVLAPSGVLAFAANPAAMHCIDEIASAPAHEHGTSHTHDNAHETSHEHSENKALDHHSDKNGNASSNCCGLFCVSALTQDPALTFGISMPASSAVVTLVSGLVGRAPTPLHRPPIA